MKKIILCLLLLCAITGCWNYQELNNYAIVTGMAIDYVDDEYEVSLLIATGKKNSENDTEAAVTVSSGKDKNIYGAIKDISLSSPKELYISHLSVIVISEEIAKDGVNPVLDFLLREPQSHQNFYLVVAKNATAKDCLSILAPLSDFPSQNITSNIKITEQLQGRITDASFTNFVSKILQKGNNPIINSLILIGDAQKGSDQEKQQNTRQEAYTKLDTLGLFKDDKLVGWTTVDESLGINMLIGDINTIYISLPCNDSELVVSSTNYKIKNNVEKDKISVDIKTKGMINEVGCTINLEDPKVIREYEKKTEEAIYRYTRLAILKAKELKTDIFGYGNLIYRKFPDYFNNIADWNSFFTTLEIDVNVEVTLNNKGALEQTIGELTK